MRAAIQQEDSVEKFSEVTKQSGMIIEAMVDPPVANLLQTTPSVQLFVSDVDKVRAFFLLVNQLIFVGRYKYYPPTSR